jgi:hypothetical protein
MELETHLALAGRIHHLSPGDLEGAMGSSGEVGRMLNGLIKSLEARSESAGVGEVCVPEPYGPPPTAHVSSGHRPLTTGH